ncbi:hypothetical protein [Paenibacillus vini]|uniref:Uncharacterized protein n=1 Tax=Paenibacillus vini TaxID=1476024 RepID=A0ABQ4MFI1_9BACL|nr:hypothetical protein [Paenibacillus vini]GIP54756.1 hypothetical protein J42TS3_37910 [Paenibacillus vini]
MNGTIKVTRTYSASVGRYMWGIGFSLANGMEKRYGGSSEIPMEVVEHALKTSVFDLIIGGYSGVNLTVELPEGVTLTDAYKAQVTTKFTGDGTIALITFN